MACVGQEAPYNFYIFYHHSAPREAYMDSTLYKVMAYAVMAYIVLADTATVCAVMAHMVMPCAAAGSALQILLSQHPRKKITSAPP